MTTIEALVSELRREAATTRRVLERVPAEKLAWKPHPKSLALGELALHIAQLPAGMAALLSRLVSPPPNLTYPPAASLAELLAAHDESVEIAASKLASWSEEDLAGEWRLVRGEETLLALPRGAMVRFMLSHWYHHRGQLTVYLRMLDVPVPALYGPSADENPFG